MDMQHRPKFELLTRLGFAARGLLYIVVGILVLQAGRAEDPNGVLEYLAAGDSFEDLLDQFPDNGRRIPTNDPRGLLESCLRGEVKCHGLGAALLDVSRRQ